MCVDEHSVKSFSSYVPHRTDNSQRPGAKIWRGDAGAHRKASLRPPRQRHHLRMRQLPQSEHCGQRHLKRVPPVAAVQTPASAALLVQANICLGLLADSNISALACGFAEGALHRAAQGLPVSGSLERSRSLTIHLLGHTFNLA